MLKALLLIFASLCVPSLVLAKKDVAASKPKAKIKPSKAKVAWTDKVKKGDALYATFETSMGNITVRLFSKDAPKTVENFVGLAVGEKEWKNPRSGAKMTKPLYDGTVFHRVIPNFMIQGGDPLGEGTGGPGYRFDDEFQSGRAFDKPCLLAMANSGPNTNGSQFFITEKATPWLNNHHTIFGEVVKGCEKVGQIARLPGQNGKVVLKHVILSDKAPVSP